MGRPRTWTDDDLRRHLPDATSWRDLRDRLGLVGGGSTTHLLRRRAGELGLDVSHLPAAGESPRRWTDKQLVDAVAAARSLKGVFDHLGLAVGGSAWQRMQDHVVRLGLDTSHWIDHGVRPGVRGARRAGPVDDDALLRILPAARSLAEVISRLGLDPTNGSSYRRVRRRIDALGLDSDHLAGQSWARGSSPVRPRRPLDEVLVASSPWRGGSSSLRDRLLDEGLLARRCATCGVERWNGRHAPLQLDHVNGDPRDNRIENLRLLCPNCHAQTATYCGRNIGNRYASRPGGAAD